MGFLPEAWVEKSLHRLAGWARYVRHVERIKLSSFAHVDVVRELDSDNSGLVPNGLCPRVSALDVETVVA